MKLLALRVAAFRRFSEGVAIEGFAPGVNVLAGPNELGKSTLFEALEAAFLVRHGTTGAVLERFRPRSGGEPVVEVDFESAGQRWRIRKQFGRSKAAVLSEIDSGRVVARAADAEDQLAHLAGVNSDGPGRVGLVWVRQQRALQAPDPDIDPLTGKAKGRGEANALMEALNDEVVEAAGAGAAEAVAARANEALGRLVTLGRDVPRKGGQYDVAIKAREAAREALQRARDAAAASEVRMARIAELTATLAALDAPGARSDTAGRIAMLEARIAEAAGQRARRDLAASELATLKLQAESAARTLADAAAHAARVSELEKKCTAARELEADIKGLVDAINADGATPARLQRLFGFEKSLSLAEAELSVPGAVVDIALEAGAEGRVTAHGKSVAAPSRIAVSESLDLAIDGIGSIRVTAAGAERAGAARRRREEAVAGLAQCLSEMEGASADEAKSRAEARRAKVETLDRARARLSGLAPQGYAALDAERGNLEKHMPALDNAGLERDAQDREIAVLAARRSLEAVAASALDDAGFRRLSADLEAARREALRREEEARRASEQLERLKGEQAGIDEDGRAGEVDKANGALTYAGDEVKRLEDEIAALKLLVSALALAIDAVRNRYFEPVTRALAPYMAEIFPEAALGFRDGFSLSALTRAGEREDFATLSDGTREQLAVLVRMGFARLFALRGATVPLVLDDPLVYSDDARLAAMCRALEHAGREYQVLLMTCREAAFQGLDAHRLTLKDWRAHPV